MNISKNISNSVLKVESDIEMTISKLTNDIMHYIFFIDIQCIRYINTCLCNSAMSVGSR